MDVLPLQNTILSGRVTYSRSQGVKPVEEFTIELWASCIRRKFHTYDSPSSSSTGFSTWLLLFSLFLRIANQLADYKPPIISDASTIPSLSNIKTEGTRQVASGIHLGEVATCNRSSRGSDFLRESSQMALVCLSVLVVRSCFKRF